MGGNDRVAAGFVSSFARPGGNITGIAFLAREMNLKRFELLAELVPQPAVIAVLVNPSAPWFEDHQLPRVNQSALRSR